MNKKWFKLTKQITLGHINYRKRYNSVLRSTIYTLIVVAALAVLVATIWLPILKIYGSSMTPTLNEGDIVVSLKGSTIEQGDLVAFYIGNKILVKRIIAGPGNRSILTSLETFPWTESPWMNRT